MNTIKMLYYDIVDVSEAIHINEKLYQKNVIFATIGIFYRV